MKLTASPVADYCANPTDWRSDEEHYEFCKAMQLVDSFAELRRRFDYMPLDELIARLHALGTYRMFFWVPRGPVGVIAGGRRA